MSIPDPGPRIQKQQQKRGVRKLVDISLPKKLSLSSQKYGSGIRDPEKPIPDPGSRGRKGTGSRIRIRNTGYRYIIIMKSTPLFKLKYNARKINLF